MSIITRLQATVQKACDLLDCVEGYLLLRCHDPALRHPLLNSLPSYLSHPLVLTGRCRWVSLVSKEPVAALCDICCYTGVMWGIDQISLPELATVGSIAVAPLAHAQGMLGTLLLIDARQRAFLQGEYLLLKQFLPPRIQQIAEILQEQQRDSETRQELFTGEPRTQGELISLVSHELRGPLTAIKGYVELLRAYSHYTLDGEQEPGPTRTLTLTRAQHYLETISEQARQLELLTGDLLDISRAQAGRLALRCTWVDLASLCQHAAHVMQDRVEQQQPACYAIRCHILAAATRAWADPNRVQQVLMNLLENAVKYSPSGGPIEVLVTSASNASAHPCDEYPSPSAKRLHCHPQFHRTGQQAPARKALMVTVRDQGIGIPRQYHDALFKPFSRVEQATTRTVNGSGLGLYIARCLVEAMQGQVCLHSSEGMGTCISFTLPTGPSH